MHVPLRLKTCLSLIAIPVADNVRWGANLQITFTMFQRQLYTRESSKPPQDVFELIDFRERRWMVLTIGYKALSGRFRNVQLNVGFKRCVFDG